MFPILLELLREELAARRGAPNIVGDDPALRKVSAALARAASTIHPRHLNLTFRDGPPAETTVDPWAGIDLSGSLADASRRVLAEVERRKVIAALAEAGGQKPRAADLKRRCCRR